MYQLRIKGVIPLQELDNESLDKMSKVIGAEFGELINLSGNTLYISGEINADLIEVFRVLLLKIYRVIDVTEDIVIKVKGDRIEDRFDYMINESGIYLYKYKLVREIEPQALMTI